MRFFDQLQELTTTDRAYLLSAPAITDCLDGRVSHGRYVAFLTEAYHHVKHTVPLLMAVGARLPGRLEWLRAAVAEYIAEEIGHQEWILNDIEACGVDREVARRSRPSLATELMVAYAYDTVHRRNPVGFFGMVNVLEGTSTALATTAAQIIRERLGLPEQAFSYLLSHGSLDQEHIRYLEGLLNRLRDAADQTAVVDTARVIYRLYGDMFRSLPAADDVPETLYA